VAVERRSTFFLRADERRITDVKSCGPGLPVLRSSPRIATSSRTTGATKPVPEEITYKR